MERRSVWPRREGNASEVLTADLLMCGCDVKTTRQSKLAAWSKRFDEWFRKGVNVYATANMKMPQSAGLRAWAAEWAVT